MDLSRPITFTLAELWLLNDLIRHEMADGDRWRYPPVSKELADEIALSILACEDHGFEEHTLTLSEGDLMVIDYNVRRDNKSPEGAVGKHILLKTFRARSELAYGYEDAHDALVVNKTYQGEVMRRAGS